MGTHRFAALFLAAAAALSLTGCGGEGDGELSAPASSADGSSVQTVQTQLPAIPFTLAFYPDYSMHPALTENRANLTLAPLIYEGLFAVDDTFQAQPVLCQSYTVSEDGLTWTFTLRQDVTFSDGTPLTGQIAAQALNTALSPPSRYAGRIPGLSSVTGGDQTVTVTLTQPNGALPVLLDIPLALDAGSRPLGTGPYVLSLEDDQPSLKARSHWEGVSLPFQEIRLFSIQQADDLIAAFDSGDVTLLDADLTGTNTLGYSGSYEVWDYNTTDLIYLGLNTAKGYFQTAQVRQALGRGLDRGSIATIPYARHAAAASLPVHPDSPLYDPELAGQTGYAPEVLVQTLERYPAPVQPLTLLVNSENNTKIAAAQHIAYQLETAGLAVQVEKLPWNDFLAALQSGQFDLYLGEVLLTADFDLSALLSSSGSLNYGRWQNDETDQLLATLRSASGARALYRHLAEQAPILPICFKNGSVLTQWGRLSGLQPRQNDVFHALEDWTLDP